MVGIKNTDYYKSGRILDSAKKANIKSTEILKDLKYKRIEDYNNNPKLCTECQCSLSYDKKNNKFCSSSCSATFNNKKRSLSEETKNKISKSLKKGSIVQKKCLYCEKEFEVEWSLRHQKFCSKSCASKNRKKTPIKIKKPEHPKVVEKVCECCKSKYIVNWWSKDIQRYCSLSCSSKRPKTKETKEFMSKIVSDKIKNGIFKPQLTSIKCLYEFKNKKIRCDSKVEYSCLNYFENNFDVLDIERCDFLIDFDYDGIIKKYNPDFKITTINDVYIVECKTILSSKELVRKWSYYYDTIEYKKIVLDKYCKENNFLSFNYNKDMNSVFYKNCKPQLIN